MVVVRSFGKHLPTILLLSHAASVMIGNSNNKIFFIWVPLLMLCELYQKQSGFTNCTNWFDIRHFHAKIKTHARWVLIFGGSDRNVDSHELYSRVPFAS